MILLIQRKQKNVIVKRIKKFKKRFKNKSSNRIFEKLIFTMKNYKMNYIEKLYKD